MNLIDDYKGWGQCYDNGVRWNRRRALRYVWRAAKFRRGSRENARILASLPKVNRVGAGRP